MKEITQLYREDIESSSKKVDPKKKWIRGLVTYLHKLKSSDWSNSIVNLPDGENKMDGNLLLLWKHNANIDALFMTKNDCNPSTPQSSSENSSPSTGSKSATRSNSNPTNVFLRAKLGCFFVECYLFLYQ